MKNYITTGNKEHSPMKCLVALSSLALVSLSNISLCLAANQASSRSSEQSLSNQSLPSATKTTQVAQFRIPDVLRTIDQGLEIKEREQRRQEERARREQLEKERQERLEAQKQREVELAAARQAATEQQRIEADRRRQYFESLSPEQKQAYIAEQRAQQQRQSEVAAKLFMMVIDSASRPDVCRRGNWVTGYTYYEC
jgi:predicted membrane metal-binding protein